MWACLKAFVSFTLALSHWCWGQDSNLRSPSGRQFYRLVVLAAHPPQRESRLFDGRMEPEKGVEPLTCRLQIGCATVALLGPMPRVCAPRKKRTLRRTLSSGVYEALRERVKKSGRDRPLRAATRSAHCEPAVRMPKCRWLSSRSCQRAGLVHSPRLYPSSPLPAKWCPRGRLRSRSQGSSTPCGFGRPRQTV